MSRQTGTKNLKVELGNFVFYSKSDVGVVLGKVSEPLFSNDKIFLDVGLECKIKFKLDCPNLSLASLASADFVEFEVQNCCEKKFFRGQTIHQFTAKGVRKYYEDNKRETVSF